VRELAPLLDNLALDLFPVTFNAIPVHVVDSFKLLVPVRGSWRFNQQRTSLLRCGSTVGKCMTEVCRRRASSCVGQEATALSERRRSRPTPRGARWRYSQPSRPSGVRFDHKEREHKMIRVGIVDDHAVVRAGLKQYLS